MRMYLSWKITGGAVLAGALAMMPTVNLTAQSGQSLSDTSGRSTTLYKTFSSTADGGTQVSISDHGNVIAYSSPSTGTTYEHLGVGALSEGYVLCYTPAFGGVVNAFDTGGGETGFGPASFPSATSIVRDTADGQLRLKQTFTFNAANKSLQIKMDVTNITNLTGAPDAPVGSLVLRRQADLDVDTGGTGGWAGFANRFFADTRDGATVWNDRVDATGAQEAHAMTLRHVLAKTFTAAGRSAKVTANILDSSCNPPHFDTAAAGYSRTDVGVTLQYNLTATLGVGKTASATVMYIRH